MDICVSILGLLQIELLWTSCFSVLHAIRYRFSTLVFNPTLSSRFFPSAYTHGQNSSNLKEKKENKIKASHFLTRAHLFNTLSIFFSSPNFFLEVRQTCVASVSAVPTQGKTPSGLGLAFLPSLRNPSPGPSSPHTHKCRPVSCTGASEKTTPTMFCVLPISLSGDPILPFQSDF